jgi:hypothetical protein
LSNEYDYLKHILLNFLYFENLLDYKRDYGIHYYHISINNKTDFSYDSIYMELYNSDDESYYNNIRIEQENVIKFIQFYNNQETYKSANKYNL